MTFPLVQLGWICCAALKRHVRMTMAFFKRRTSLISVHPVSLAFRNGTLSPNIAEYVSNARRGGVVQLRNDDNIRRPN